MTTNRFSDFLGPAYEPEDEPTEMMSNVSYFWILVGALALTVAGLFWLGRKA